MILWEISAGYTVTRKYFKNKFVKCFSEFKKSVVTGHTKDKKKVIWLFIIF